MKRGDEKIEMQGDMRHGCFLVCRHRLFPPFPPMFKVNKLAKHSVNLREKEVETERGMKETELLPSDAFDGSV